ncbi:hypothetical protein ETU10_00110 [Apibacter muscae]|uniref:hypothetical protein n=1 Tax=Apibacter muscae TaxID=2509004 RepID=UPI0011ACA676|nr:hypothetical protein [Apibacter muscae]TWP25380.1 hypothetical protein ETU10_00110 [Apibacter muscae]
MKKYDKRNEEDLLEGLEDSELKNVEIISSDEIRKKMIDKFIKTNPIPNRYDDRFFLNLIDSSTILKNPYCIEVLKNNPQTGKFYMFAEQSKSCLILNNWEEVIEILENLPYMNVYILDEQFSYVISVTQEDNMVYTGIELKKP